MTAIRRLLWVLPHPTPFNTYLLNSLTQRLDVPSEAVYRFGVLPSHPWTALPDRHFPNREIRNPGGRDSELEAVCESDSSTLVLFSGWRDKTMFPAMRRRWSRRLPYGFWSDTPKVGNGIARRLLNAVQVFFTRRAQVLLATGSPAITNYTKMGVSPAILKNFPVVVDPAHFEKAFEARKQRLRPHSTVFVLPARLIDYMKGQRTAIQALALASQAMPEHSFRLILAGVGPDKEMIREFATSRGVGNKVELRGWVEYDAAPDMYSEADALVIPSWWDPYPVVVIEAMATGLPVLGSEACGTVRERVVQGENGFMHRTGNSSELAEHMVAFARSTEESRRRMGENALKTSKDWGIDICVATMKSLLSELSAA